MKTKRKFAGYYVVEHKVDEADYYQVDVEYRPDLQGWIAAALWDRHLYTDPIPTKRDAVYNARIMIEDAINARIKKNAAALDASIKAAKEHNARLITARVTEALMDLDKLQQEEN
jgi:hypothetical protein